MSTYDPTRIASGANLRDCEKLAKQLGCDIETVNGTGEIRFSHPTIQKSIRVGGRRKDAPRALTAWLNGVGRNV
jgi:NACalpha-BTF3-like transcription factor